ncbi:RraA family protein [Amycolatopsis pigmentata]|uniref:Putative 4-hydroxy-4-methyl-2-oxoglutarate aldolase n=1 Tax=Amycolatopsis pigmentata TaxID=450801 RepID=A0ABW5FK96_9PSEU
MTEPVAAAVRLGTCALSDALDALGVRGVLPGVRALAPSGPVGGRAVTVQLGPADGNVAKRHLCTAAVDSAGPGQIIVIAHPGPHEGVVPAGWGGILSLAAHRKGVEAAVVGGAVRDVDEARELGFPVFGRSATPVTARGRVVETGWGEPVVIGEVAVAPGDVVVGDENGVVVIPAGLLDDVIERGETIVAREAAIAAAVRDGVPVAEAMGRDYEKMLE